MGRKEDEQGKVSKDTNGSCIDELRKKCKPLNIHLSRLKVPKSGVVVVKDNVPEQLIDLQLNKSNSKISNTVSNITEIENEENSNDTAETIKKIKEFIALGRCEEVKKDQDPAEKKGISKAKTVTKAKVQNKNHSNKITNKKRSSVINKEIDENDLLEKTLKGQDDAGTNKDHVSTIPSTEGDPVSAKNQTVEDLKNAGSANAHLKNNELLITPSRVSKRIQNKPIKFSVKNLLKGNDVNVLKRMIPGYDNEHQTPIKKERITEKKVKVEVKKPTTLIPDKILASSPSPGPSQETTINHDVTATSSKNSDIDNSEEILQSSVATNQNTGESNTHSSDDESSSNKEKVLGFSDHIGKVAMSNGKITIEFGGSSQKQFVRIAQPPANTQPAGTNPSLGPDIIVKRVRSVKKTVVLPDHPVSGTKGIIEKEVFVEHSSSNNIKAQPGVSLERVGSPNLVENFVRRHKNILRRSRNNRKRDKLKSQVLKQNNDKTEGILATKEGDGGRKAIFKNYKDSEVHSSISRDGSISVEAPDGNKPKTLTMSESKSRGDPLKKQISNEKVKGRKTAKVMPLTFECEPKTSNTVKELDHNFFPKLSASNEETHKEIYNNLFDRYFSTKERFAQHHDSLDSDSSEDFNDEIYAHFINLKKRKDQKVNEEIKKYEATTMHDLMQDISIELPSWNIHVASEGQVFCLAEVDLIDKVPTLKKVIEIDLDYNAKVYIAGAVLPEFEGNYNDFKNIRQLIYDVNQL